MRFGTIRRWLKQAGQSVARGEALLEIETDDGLAVIEAATGGILQSIAVMPGRTIAVGTPLAVIGESAAEAAPKPAIPPQSREQKQETKSMSAAQPSGPVIPVLMPKAGQSMEEGTLLKWHVKVGDRISKGQVIFEIETDKANMDVEATDAGRVAKIVLKEGDVCKVLEPVAYLAENDADVAAVGTALTTEARSHGERDSDARSQISDIKPQTATSQIALTETGRVKASPAARKIAGERGIDLKSVGNGSGPGGRILSGDVPSSAVAVAAAPAPVAAAVADSAGVVRRKMSTMRRAIAKNLSISKQTIPHFYLKGTINADALYSFYQTEKAKYQCSLNDVVVMACARAIREMPPFRSRVEGDEVIELPSVNIGIAVGLDEGLVVPVLVDADKLTLKQIGESAKRIAVAAKAGKIEGMNKGVFTITNMGMFGVEEFSAIINPPESAILAVGAVREEVIVSGGTLRAGRVMTMTISVDHRIIDGTMAAKFMKRMREILEYPGQLVG